jgi:hypothetical protein
MLPTLLLAFTLAARADSGDTDTDEPADTAPAGQSLSDISGDDGGALQCGGKSVMLLGAAGLAASAIARRRGT